MAQEKRVLIICGEASGDLNAANLIKGILEINPGIKISGVGGALMRGAGADIYYDIKELAVIGFFDVLKKLPRFFALKKLILRKIGEQKPDLIILVDFSGFNLRIAKTINKTIPTIYYISPQVWASRPGRINTIKRYISKLIVLFKFEEEFYKKFGVDADFVGHPLLDIVRPTMEKKEFLNTYGLSATKTTIALLPGSRKTEIEHILPVMLKASIFINKALKDVQFVIVKSPQVEWQIINQKIKNLNLDLKIVEGKTYDCLNIADACLVASGTATLETAIMQKPFMVIYKMNILNYLLYRPQVKVPYISLVNILAKKEIIPEFIQFQATPEKVAGQLVKLLQDTCEMERMKNNLSLIKSFLGENGANQRAARIIVDFLYKPGA